ncbi:chaperone modulator CbpM [Azospirillum halopraeferens]|uniref:chaperone modulator CbpM n=1 Tax=Azospirillum halopraeferens TaxID=34010 RepID=UPI0004087E7B|nr:chaperone modulator CbpM [Azospirillum halopraeferens]
MTVIGFDAALATCRRVSSDELTLWIERRWVRPQHAGTGWGFSAADVARIELICDLRHDLAIDDETVPVVLSLLDTVHGLRHRLALLAEAVARLPPESRAALAGELRRLERERDG